MSRSASSVPHKLWSPLHRLITLTTMFSLVFGGLLLTVPGNASAQSTATVQDHLNLRAEPHTDAPILTVMPPGSTVTINGDAQAGFLPVSYNGMTGFAHADWIGSGAPAAPPASNTGNTGTAYVIDGALNLRSGPSTGNSIITVMPGGSAVSLTGESAGGFLGVVYNGTSGWAHSDYLSTSGAPTQPAPSDPGAPVGDTVVGTMTTTAALNMRSGASTSNGIITTIPYGATVEVMGSAVDGWYPVRYAGNKGWSHGGYLSGNAEAPAPTQPTPAPAAPSNPVAIGDTVVGTMYVSTGLNLRSGPGTTHGVLVVMPTGATVSVMGEPVSGFYPLTFNGTKGWASADYLSSSAVSVPVAPTPGRNYTTDELIQIIYAAADKYGQPRADMLRVAQCESVLDPNVINPYSGASGLFQFMPGTWATTPFANQNIFDPVANAEAAGWMWQNGRRNEWVCQ